MKKLSTLLVLAAFTFFFTACNKEYSCTCSETIKGVPSVVNVTQIKDTKQNAESKCSQLATSSYGGSGANVSCKLD